MCFVLSGKLPTCRRLRLYLLDSLLFSLPLPLVPVVLEYIDWELYLDGLTVLVVLLNCCVP